jgi:hypothetical protein
MLAPMSSVLLPTEASFRAIPSLRVRLVRGADRFPGSFEN